MAHLGLVVFFGGHSVSGSRAAKLPSGGPRAWQLVYSIIALLGFYLLVTGYGAARATAVVLYVAPPWLRFVAAVLMLPAFTLALASVLPGRIRALSRHPLLVATLFWAVAHLLTNGDVADLLLFGTFLLWAVAVLMSLERRPARRKITLPKSVANDAIAVAADSRSTRFSFSGCTQSGSAYHRLA